MTTRPGGHDVAVLPRGPSGLVGTPPTRPRPRPISTSTLTSTSTSTATSTRTPTPVSTSASDEGLFPDAAFETWRTPRPREPIVPLPLRTLARLARRGAQADRLRLAASIVAIVIAVAFMAATQVLTATLSAGFHGSVGATYGDAALVVRSTDGVASDLGTARPPVPAALVERLRSVPGVAAVEGRVRSQVAVLDHDGRPIGREGAGPTVVARNWPAAAGWTIVQGAAPAAADDLAIDERSATDAHVAPGDLVAVQTVGGLRPFRVAGIARGGDGRDTGPTVLLDTATAQAQLLRPDEFNWIEITAATGRTGDELREPVAAALGDRATVVTTDEFAAETRGPFDQLLDAVRGILTILAAVALVVGAFIIHNTYTIVVAQRSRELALLRAIGASRRQALGSIALEAAGTGAVAIAVGLALGAVLARVLAGVVAGGMGGDSFAQAVSGGTTIALDHLELPARALLAIALASLAVTVASAWLPAWQACRVPPVAALTASLTEPDEAPTARRKLGKALLATGAVLAGLALANRGARTVPLVAAGGLLATIGMVVVGPALVGPITDAVRPLDRVLPIRFARRNAARHPRRAAATASALTIGVALIVLFGVVVGSLKVTVDRAIDTLFAADLVVDAGTFGQTGMDPSFLSQVRAVPGVATATGIELGFATVDGTATQVIGADVEQLLELVHLDETRGSLAGLRPDEVAIDVTTAATKGWKVGSTIPTSLADPRADGTAAAPVKVGAVFDTGGAGNGLGIVMSTEGFESHFPVQQHTLNQIFVATADGTAPADVQRGLADLVRATYPSAQVRDLEAYKQAQSGLLDVVLSVIGALVVLAGAIAVLGIGNTLALSIHERTREIGMLRAVGMTRGQVRASVRWESVLFAAQGTLTGLALGGAVGWALVGALTIQGASLEFAAPWPLLVGILVAAVLAALVAAQLPAIAAARLDPVRAIRR